MSSPAERAILLGLQIGNSIEEPINRAMIQKSYQEFRRKFAEEQLAKEMQLAMLKDPNLAQSRIAQQAGITVDGQESVKPMPLNVDPIMIGGQAFDPGKYKKLTTDDELSKAERELLFRKKIEDYKQEQPQYNDKLGVEIIRTPEGFRYRQILPYREGETPLKGTIDKEQEFQKLENEKDRENKKTLAELALEQKRDLGIKMKTPSSAQVTQISGLELLGKRLDDIEKFPLETRQANVGFFDSTVKYLQNLTGVGNQDSIKLNEGFRNAVDSLVAEFSFGRGGKSLTVNEKEVLSEYLPKLTKSDASFEARLGSFRQLVNELKTSTLQTLEDSGYDVSKFHERKLDETQNRKFEVPEGMKIQKNKKTGEFRLVPK